MVANDCEVIETRDDRTVLVTKRASKRTAIRSFPHPLCSAKRLPTPTTAYVSRTALLLRENWGKDRRIRIFDIPVENTTNFVER